MGLRIFGSSSRFDSQPTNNSWLNKAKEKVLKPIDRLAFTEKIKKLENEIEAANSLQPDPAKWRLWKHKQVGQYLVAAIFYPNCKNYEGKKILVFKGIVLEDLEAQGLVDPHFSENPNYHSPIARFVPTTEGWDMAIKLAEKLEGEQ